MTIPSHTTIDGLTGGFAAAGRGVEVRWSAVVAASADDAPRGPIVLVLTIEPVDDLHALLEAWVEAPDGILSVFPRQPVACRITESDGLVHVDADHHGRRLATLSVSNRPSSRPLLFARSTLLCDAGFAPGAHDPPTARLLMPTQDVASA